MEEKTEKLFDIKNQLLKKIDKNNEISEHDYLRLLEEYDISQEDNDELQKFLKLHNIHVVAGDEFDNVTANFADINDVIALYRQDMSNYSVLSEDEEIELGKRIKAGDKTAVDELVEHNLRLVFFVIKEKKLSNVNSVSFEDMIAAGNIGLIRAAEKFDYTAGRFSTYATWWIWNEIQKTIQGDGEAFKVSETRLNEKKELFAMINILAENHYGEEPDDELLSFHLHWPLSKVKEVKRFAYLSNVLSFDQSLTNEKDGLTFGDVQNDEEAEKAITSKLDEEDLREQIDKYLSVCNEREQYVISHFYGLDGAEEESLTDIGKTLGISRERVRQIKEHALFVMKEEAKKENE